MFALCFVVALEMYGDEYAKVTTIFNSDACMMFIRRPRSYIAAFYKYDEWNVQLQFHLNYSLFF